MAQRFYFKPESFHFKLSTCRNCWVKDEWWLQKIDSRNNIWTVTKGLQTYYRGYIANDRFAQHLFINLGIL
jgi:hypothetical protein